jgi:AraC-like DNA-binding protein
VYEGVSYERIGNAARAKSGVATAGIVGLHLPAPGIIFYPAGTPHGDGALSRMRRSTASARLLAMTFMREEVQPFLVHHDSTRNEVTHLLQVRDPLLVKMGEIYLDELRQPDNAVNAQLQLRALMGRLYRYLQQNQPQVCNSSLVEPARFAPIEGATRLQHHEQLARDITYYVLTHLQMPLTASGLAQHFGISTVQLNRVFHEIYGISPMRYVTQQRLQAAKRMLNETSERISDVARLVGFASSSSFCTLFVRHIGMSPNEYRRESRQATQSK